MSAATSSPLTRGHVLLVGADGQLGTELRRALAARGITPMMSSLRGTVPDGARAHACDLSIPGALAALVREVAPSFVLNAAAYTAVDRAEFEPDLARRLNAEAVSELGAVAKELGATVVHYSTDYVFAGDSTRPYREDDAPGPVSVYGRTKLEGEQALAASGADAVTFRLAWVYAAHSSNFLRTMLKVGAERDALRVVADQVGAPTPAHWIAEASL
ncbi:MAG: SDR family oxidoreductase, partial [Lysobacteraceae bacterium]